MIHSSSSMKTGSFLSNSCFGDFDLFIDVCFAHDILLPRVEFCRSFSDSCTHAAACTSAQTDQEVDHFHIQSGIPILTSTFALKSRWRGGNGGDEAWFVLSTSDVHPDASTTPDKRIKETLVAWSVFFLGWATSDQIKKQDAHNTHRAEANREGKH